VSIPPPATGQLIWRKELPLAGLLALVPMTVVVLFARLSGDWFCLVEDDGLSFHQPLLSESIRRVLAGELPLWSPNSGCGYPHFARSAALYPVHYLSHAICWLLGLGWQEMAVSHVLHLGAAAGAAFLYLRFLQVERWPATLAALGYSLAGPLLGMATNWNEMAFMAPYVPLGFLVIEHLIAGERSWVWPCFGGLLGALYYMPNGPLGAFKFALLLGLYFLLRCRRATFGFALRRLMLTGVLAFLGCAGQLAATWQLMQLSPRISAEGVSAGEGLNIMACSPEFYRGFVYPLIEFHWPRTYYWCDHFNGSALFVGPLAILGVILAVVYARRVPGPHRALLVLLGIYFVLSLGSYFDGNTLLQGLPLFRQHRWPVRWTVEFCLVAALLTGVGLQLGWNRIQDRRTRTALIAYVVVVFLALTVRTSEATEWEFQPACRNLVLPWLLTTLLLAYYFHTRRKAAFYLLGLAATVGALVVNVPGAQRHRFGHMRDLAREPLRLNEGSQERVLHLSSRKDQLAAGGEGNYAYCLAHQLGLRSVTTYGPMGLRTQAWQAGLDSQAEVTDPDEAADTFLRGHLLETLRVSHVVIPRDDPVLNRACRTNPRLRWLRDTEWKSIYVHQGFREPAFFVAEARPETELASWADLGREPLSRICYTAGDYSGPRSFQPDGTVSDFHEENETIRLKTDTPRPQLLVVTTTNYPGWQAFVDGQPAELVRVNGSFMGLAVPAGAHDVYLRYHPTALIALTWLSVGVLVFLFGYCSVAFLCFRCRERPLPYSVVMASRSAT
jgi:hypothetical protein